MTDKELRKLGRRELLEILLDQSREVARLQQELEEANEKLADRRIVLDNSGSIAEAALKLSGIFEAAQKAADQYLESLGAPGDLSEAQAECDELRRKAREECQAMMETTQIKCEELFEKTKDKCRQMEYDALRRDLLAKAENSKKGGS